MADLHAALKTSVIGNYSDSGVNYLQVRLQNGKDLFRDTLHARPNSYSSSGIQTTDFLSLIGFKRSPCAFHHSECFCREIATDIDGQALAAAITKAYGLIQDADRRLESCGLYIDQPEGWGFFYGKPPGGRRIRPNHSIGNGHVAPIANRLKESEDDFFRFVLTWIDGAGDKGWTTHYRAKHMPLTEEFQAALEFLGGFQGFADCPEYDFEGCWWRFTKFQSRGDSPFDSNVDVLHRTFDALSSNFSAGIQSILNAHAILKPFGLSFLSKPSVAISLATSKPSSSISSQNKPSPAIHSPSNGSEHTYDVAFSFAGPERKLAEEIATIVQKAGFNVFYDNFYPEQLWGQDLAAKFDRIYRKESRFCVMFLSKEYKDRIWTTHERRSATARALQERGNEYILPVKVEDVDIDGLAPTVGYVSLSELSPAQIADLLIKKLS